MDAINIPTMHGVGQTKKTLDTTLHSLFPNHANLRMLTYLMAQNKQYSTFSLTALQKHIISSCYAACSENKMLVDTLTFASNAAMGDAVALDPKLKGESFVLLDVKDTHTRVVFVVNGKTVGFYPLPFGYELLRASRVIPEDTLFDHSFAALSVLNASERARAKKLTVFGSAEARSESPFDTESAGRQSAPDTSLALPEEQEDMTDAEQQESPSAEAPDPEEVSLQNYARKAPRRLPKFMQREVPTDQEGILAENFRVFVKWTLDLIAANSKLTALGKPSFVCVNLPHDLLGVLDGVNATAEENGILFRPLFPAQLDASVSANLELYGGLFPKTMHASNTF
jgi:hypothetical protein